MKIDDHSETPDERLIAQARQGSKVAMGQLLAGFQQYLALVAARGVDADLRAKFGSSDVVQETMLEAQRDFAQFRGQTRGELQAWLRRLLLNNLLNQTRAFRSVQRRAVANEVPLHEIPPGLAPSAGDSSPSQRAVRQEEAELLRAALDQLPEHYREVIVLRNHQQLTFTEIGRRTGRSEDAARMLWARAFERLADLLEMT